MKYFNSNKNVDCCLVKRQEISFPNILLRFALVRLYVNEHIQKHTLSLSVKAKSCKSGM